MVKYIAAFLLFTSCATVQSGGPKRHLEDRFLEPQRSQMIMACGMQGAPITFCLCVEEILSKKSKEPQDIGQNQFGQAVKQCQRILQEPLEKEIKDYQRAVDRAESI